MEYYTIEDIIEIDNYYTENIIRHYISTGVFLKPTKKIRKGRRVISMWNEEDKKETQFDGAMKLMKVR